MRKLRQNQLLMAANGSDGSNGIQLMAARGPSVLYLPKCAVLAGNPANTYSTLGQIQHAAAFQVYNMEIKVHFPFDRAHAKYNKYV